MSLPLPQLRNYKTSDDYMLQDSRTILVHFKEDKNAFIALDDDFKDPFAANWEAAIKTAQLVPDDEVVVDVQTGLTTTVNNALQACKTHFQRAKYPIEKAFSNNPAVLSEFGFDNYNTAQRTPEKMVAFMEVFGKTANKYKAQLIAAKYTQADIDAIDTKKNALINAKTNQNVAKNQRIGTTQNRIGLHNTVWDFRTKVAKAAKHIFEDDYGRYQLYLLPASDEAKTQYAIYGTVTDKTTGAPLSNVEISLGNEKTQTDNNGAYGISKADKQTTELTAKLNGYKPLSQNINYDGKSLVINLALEKL